MLGSPQIDELRVYVDALPLDSQVVFRALAGLDGEDAVGREGLEEKLDLSTVMVNRKIKQALTRIRLAMGLGAEVEDDDIVETLVIGEVRRKARAVLAQKALESREEPWILDPRGRSTGEVRAGDLREAFNPDLSRSVGTSLYGHGATDIRVEGNTFLQAPLPDLNASTEQLPESSEEVDELTKELEGAGHQETEPANQSPEAEKPLKIHVPAANDSPKPPETFNDLFPEPADGEAVAAKAEPTVAEPVAPRREPRSRGRIPNPPPEESA